MIYSIKEQYFNNRKKSTLQYLQVAGLNQFWIKVGHHDFYKAELTASNFLIIKTRKISQNPESRIERQPLIINGFEHLSLLAEQKDNGCFFGCSDGFAQYPLKKYQKKSTQIVVEIDDLSQDKQLNLYKEFEKLTHLKPYLISSGGKSIHFHLLLDKPLNIDKVIYLRRLFTLLWLSDLALCRSHQPFRFPNVFRGKTGTYQSIIQCGEPYSYPTIVNAIKILYEKHDLKFPQQITNNWFNYLISFPKKEKLCRAKKINFVRKRLKIGPTAWEKIKIERSKKMQAQNMISYSDQDLSERELALLALKNIPAKATGDGRYSDEFQPLASAFKNIVGENEAIEILSFYNPQYPHHKISQIVKSSDGNHTIGTIIYIARKYGFELNLS